MFDIGFSELLVIGVVALIVIGPERLPRVARAAGHIFGRMQRYLTEVRNEINSEIKLEELRKLEAEMRQKTASVEHVIIEEARTVVEQTKTAEAPSSENPGKNPPNTSGA